MAPKPLPGMLMIMLSRRAQELAGAIEQRARRMVAAFAAIGMIAVMAYAIQARADATADTLAAAQAADARHDYATELKLLRPLAEQGDALAQFNLGAMYADGQGVPKDYAEAVRWYRKAAEQGDASAQNNLGLMYADGQGVPKDYAEAVRWYRKAAEQGDASAQNNLGLMYADGQGVPKDYAEAVRWYHKAAEKGNVMAQVSLGTMYVNGDGVPKDYAEATRWLRKGAEQGDALAQGKLGTMYILGQGVPKDYVQAYMWFNLAAAGGENEATKLRDGLEHLMTAQQIAEAQQRTAAWRPVQPGTQQQSAPAPADAKPEPSSGQLGTGFFIGEDGMVLTNAHVVEGCSEARIGPHGRSMTARVVARDTENDLALLRADVRSPTSAALRLSVRQGEAVAAYGYPLPGLLASGGNLTEGNITALSGVGDDSRLLQISAPVQPGNSGGPLLDGGGNVVGIVEGKLNAIKIASVIGDVPQNVNFAIKASVMATFLDANGVRYATWQPGTARSPADIAEEAKRFTVPVECDGSAQ